MFSEDISYIYELNTDVLKIEIFTNDIFRKLNLLQVIQY